MSIDNQDSHVNAAFALQNKNVLKYFKSLYPALAPLTCTDNVLYLNDESFPLGYFRLNQVNSMICELPPKNFFELIKLLADIENNITFEDVDIYSVSEIIYKSNLDEKDEEKLKNFVDKYLALKKYEDYLSGSSTVTLSKYRQVINNVLYLSDPNNLTEAQKYITGQVLANNESLGGKSNGFSRILKNPNIPNMAPDDNQGFSKAGFASILLIIYTIINAAIILAIHLIK